MGYQLPGTAHHLRYGKKVVLEGDEMPHGVAIAVVEMTDTRKVKDGYEWIYKQKSSIA